MTTAMSGLFKLVGSLSPIFVGFLYYVSRRFTESYYETLGVPHAALNFSEADYLFKSMQSWMFLIAIALTYLVFVLWQSVFRKEEPTLWIPSRVDRKESKPGIWISIGRTIIRVFRPKKDDPQLLGLFYFFYSIFGLALLIIWILPTAEPNFPAEAFSETMMPVFSIGLAWLIMTDKPTIDFIKGRKRIKQLFIGSIILIVLISMYLLPHGIGRFAGIVQTNPYKIEQVFPSIKIVSDKKLWEQDLEWIEKDDMYETNNKLILIFQNNDGVFVKKLTEEEIAKEIILKKISKTYYIPDSNIQGLSINIPGKFPKGE